MKNILLIGVGGAGSKTVDMFYKRMKEMGKQTDCKITAIVFDTDMKDIASIKDATPIPMQASESVGTICDRIGTQYLREWFPCDENSIRAQELSKGASQWRKKSYLAFLNLMNHANLKNRFDSAMEKMIGDPDAFCEVYVVSSVAGGTGSGSFIPIALYAKKFLNRRLGKEPRMHAMILLPDIFEDCQTAANKTKVCANAYAIFRELNAINLVARNYNDDNWEQKRAKINIRIGSVEEPNVGLLFDSNDPACWTPAAAPFHQVYLMGKIPGISPFSHYIVLANALYTLICTETGGAFDSEASNQEALHSQSNGANAIFTAISTSQMAFPKESILDYLACKRTSKACDEDWLTLHQETEKKIKEKEREAKDTGVRFIMKDGDYAEFVLEALENLRQTNNQSVIELVDLDTITQDDEGTELTTAEAYLKNLVDNILAKHIPDQPTIIKDEDKKKKLAGKLSKNEVKSLAKSSRDTLKRYLTTCVDVIRKSRTSLADAILTLDPVKAASYGKEYSLIDNVLMSDSKKYIHPVAALVQLCRLKYSLETEYKNDTELWTETMKPGNATVFPKNLLTALDARGNQASAYAKMGVKGDKPFSRILNNYAEWEKAYTSVKRTATNVDFTFILDDAEKIAKKIKTEAINQLTLEVFSRVSANIQILLTKYREFFNRFAKEKVVLEEMVKSAERKDTGNVNGVENVCSSVTAKRKILKAIGGSNETIEELKESFDIAGKGVLQTVLKAAAATLEADEKDDDEVKFNENSAAAYQSLFAEMINAYKKFISNSDAYRNAVAETNVFKAIEDEAGVDAKEEDLAKLLRAHFAAVSQAARPSVQLKKAGNSPDGIEPENIIVYMVSKNTGAYIKRRADFYEIAVPTDKASEDDAIEACVETFIKKYSEDSSARIVVVDGMSDQVLYCTGETINITPLHINRVDELDSDPNSYFACYETALENAKKYKTDMWNPHLGFGFEKRGCLPYINPEMEKICDEKMAKALIYALATEKICLEELKFGSSAIYAFYLKGSNTALRTADGKFITMQNLAKMVEWVRNQDDLVEEYSKRYDREIETMKLGFPNLVSDEEIGNLKTHITKTPFIGWLDDKGLFEEKAKSETAFRFKQEGKKGPSILDLAYSVKVSEESSRDNDDAERIIALAYKTFMEFCSFRATPEKNAERFIDIYKHEINNFYEALAESKSMKEAEDSATDYFKDIVAWLNNAGLFLDIPEKDAFKDDGTINYANYVLSSDVVNTLAGSKKSAGKKSENTSEEADKAEKAEKPAKSEKSGKSGKSKKSSKNSKKK